MRNRLKKMRIAPVVAVWVIVAVECVSAQVVNTHSPYSRYGLGLQEHQAYSGVLGWGGVSIGVLQKNAVNPANPASYGRQDSMTFMFDFGVQGGYTRYLTQSGEARNAGQGNIQHVAIKFPLARWAGMALGFQPYSQLGYDVTRYETDLQTISRVGRVRYQHTGYGGVNEAFLGVGFSPLSYIQIGVNAHYRFGSINHAQSLYVPGNTTYSTYSSENRNVVKAVMLRGGIQARIPLDTVWRKSLSVGVTLDYYPYVYAEQRLEATTSYWNTSMRLAQNALRGTERMKLPLRYGAGAVYETASWMVGCDFVYEMWNDFSWFGRTQGLKPSWEVHLGTQYTPDAQSMRRYYERVSYRVGAMYSRLPMRIDGREVHDMGLTVGFGLPIGWRRWIGNIALEVGQRGGFGKDVVKETYCNLHLGVTFIDRWFFKRKYD